jgi:Cohesin domain
VLKRYFSLLMLLCLWAMPSFGQEEETYLLLGTETRAMETGQTYTVRIEVANTPSFWAANMVLSYDPAQIYIIGTQAGSPVEISTEMGDAVIPLFNAVDATAGRLNFGLSLLNPAEPKTGSFVLGTFEIVPLLAGESDLSFLEAQVTTIDFDIDAEGQRTNLESLSLEFLPVLLELNAVGEPVEAPSEATATPTPSATPDPALSLDGSTEEVVPTELVNITLAPNTEVSENETNPTDNSSLLFVGIGLVILAAIGLILLFVMRRRS